MLLSTIALVLFSGLGTQPAQAWHKWSNQPRAVGDTGISPATNDSSSSMSASMSSATSSIMSSVSAVEASATSVDASATSMAGASQATTNTADGDPSTEDPLPGYSVDPFPYPLNTSLQGHSAYISSAWADAHEKARQRLASWTLQEKVNLTTGAGWSIGRCVGNINPIPTQNFSGLCLEDSPLGVRFADFVSAFPAGINVAST